VAVILSVNSAPVHVTAPPYSGPFFLIREKDYYHDKEN
jgi:hypothetical protein